MEGSFEDERSIQIIEHVMNEGVGTLQDPDNHDLIRYMLEICTLVVDLLRDRRPAQWGLLQAGSIARVLESMPGGSAGLCGDVLIDIEEYLRHTPRDLAVAIEAFAVARLVAETTGSQAGLERAARRVAALQSDRQSRL